MRQAVNSEEVLQHRALAATRDTMVRTTYLTVDDLRKRWGVSRQVVEGYPIEVLPYMNATPNSSRSRRRYNPSIVAAAEEVWIPGWHNAMAMGEGERYLKSLRELHTKRQAQILARVTGVAE
jgi:hypothetical protein